MVDQAQRAVVALEPPVVVDAGAGESGALSLVPAVRQFGMAMVCG